MKKIFIFILLSISVLHTNAQDRIFNYVYQSTILNKGQAELEIWNTFRYGRIDYYRAFRHRLEFEIGVAKNLQTAFYLNINTASQYNIEKKLVFNNSVITEQNDTSISTVTDFSFSNEWKYKLSDQVASFIGSALYAEIELGSKSSEIEFKLILDKKFGKFITALNLVGVYEIEKEMNGGIVENKTEFGAEIVYGLSYQLNKNLHIGLEAKNLNGFHEGVIESSVLYAGPVFSYLKDNFWINLTIFPQVTAFKGANYNGLELAHNSKLETRLLFSYAF